jgi:hypothetical protein
MALLPPLGPTDPLDDSLLSPPTSTPLDDSLLGPPSTPGGPLDESLPGTEDQEVRAPDVSRRVRRPGDSRAVI